MKAVFKALIVVGMTAPFLFAGCASTADGRLAQAQGAGLGAGGGALLGALIGYAAGKEDGALAGAAIGGLLGGASGYAYGSHVAARKKQYADYEQYLDACIASAMQKNREAVAYNRRLAAEIAKLEARAKVAIAKNDENAKSDLRNAIANLQYQTRIQIQAINEEINLQNQALLTQAGSSSIQLETLKSEISSLESARAQSEQEFSRLISLQNRLSS